MARRDALLKKRVADLGRQCGDVDELGFVILSIVQDFLLALPDAHAQQDLDELLGMLERVKLTFAQRLVLPFKEGK